jgi:hypothetical protein
MTMHLITADMVTDRGYCMVVSAVEFTFPSLDHKRTASGRYSLGFSPEGTPGRKVYGGPEVTERFGWLNEQATVIALHPLGVTAVIVAEVGDILMVQGHGDFVIVDGNWHTHGRPMVEAI